MTLVRQLQTTGHARPPPKPRVDSTISSQRAPDNQFPGVMRPLFFGPALDPSLGTRHFFRTLESNGRRRGHYWFRMTIPAPLREMLGHREFTLSAIDITFAGSLDARYPDCCHKSAKHRSRNNKDIRLPWGCRKVCRIQLKMFRAE